jgi:hypothetical protein
MGPSSSPLLMQSGVTVIVTREKFLQSSNLSYELLRQNLKR